MNAREIVLSVCAGNLPKGSPLPFTEIKGARLIGKNTITADVTMFDGPTATMRLNRWPLGWSHGWDVFPVTDIFFGKWRLEKSGGAIQWLNANT